MRTGGSFYYQLGKANSGKDVKSLCYSVFAGVKIMKPMEIMAGYDHYSGTNLSRTDKAARETNTFSTLYGSGHNFLGYMDHYTDIQSHTKGAGINDLYFRLNLILAEKHKLEGTCHLFSLDQKYITDAVIKFKEVNKDLGQEINLMYTYTINKQAELNAGYCFMMPTRTAETLKGIAEGKSKFPQWAYVMITWKPVFFTTADKP